MPSKVASTVIDQQGKVVHAQVEHAEAGLSSILNHLRRPGKPARLPVAIARPGENGRGAADPHRAGGAGVLASP